MVKILKFLKKPVLIFVLILLLIVILFLIPGVKHKNYVQIKASSNISKVQREIIFDRISQFPDNTQIAISFIDDDTCLFYGVIKQNDTIKNIDNKMAVFEIGSITKLFTATLLADFILEGIVSPDSAINNYLDIQLKNDIKLYFKDLANHTSGLPRKPSDYFSSVIKSPLNPYKHYSYKELENFMCNKMELKSERGTKYRYSNLGMGILGYVLCKIAQKNYEELLKEKILLRYKLESTTTIRSVIKDNLVNGIGPLGNKTPNWDMGSHEAAGGILSCVYDLSTFVKAQFDSNNTELFLTRKSTFVIDSTKEIGMGWHILKNKSENNWYWHNGGTGGYRSGMLIDIADRKGIVVLSNISMAHRKSKGFDEFCFHLMKNFR